MTLDEYRLCIRDYAMEQVHCVLESALHKNPGKDPELQYRYTAHLDLRVMCVAVINVTRGEWCAYMSGCPGLDHSIEWWDTRLHGTLMGEWEATRIFPGIDQNYTEDL